MKYSKWLDKWYSAFIKPTLKGKTCERYHEVIEKHLKVRLGEYALKEITPSVIRRYVAYLAQCGNLKTGKPLSSSSINGIISIIQSSVKTAYESGEIKRYTLQRVARPKSEGRKVSCFTEKEQEIIEFAALNDNRRSHFGIVLCLYSGLRIGELLALTWSDVDLENGMIYVNKTCYYGKDEKGVFGRITGEPKTMSSKRDIPLPKRFLPILKQHKKHGKSEYVIEGENGMPISVRSYQRSFSILQRNLAMKEKGFHSLRHTFATRALESGMDVKTLSEILGHNDASVTLNRYTHSMIKHKREMMDRLGICLR